MSSWFDDLRSSVGTWWRSGDAGEIGSAGGGGPARVDLVPDDTPNLDPAEVHPTTRETFLAPEAEVDVAAESRFKEELGLAERGVLQDWGDSQAYQQRMLDGSNPEEQAHAVRNLVLQQENIDALYGKGFHEAFMSGVPNPAKAWGLIEDDGAPGNVRGE